MITLTQTALIGLSALSAFSLWRAYGPSRRDHKMLREVIESSHAARVVLDSQNKVLLFNSRFVDLCRPYGGTGLQSFMRIFGNDSSISNALLDIISQARKQKKASGEYPYTQMGQETWLRITAQHIPGLKQSVHLRIEDITLEREQQKLIEEDQRKLVDYTDNAPVGFFSVDEEGRFVFVNATFARWVETDSATLLHEKKLADFLVKPPENAAPYDIKDGGGVRQTTELKMKTRDGREFLASITQTVVHEGDGQVRTRAVVNDLTAQNAIRKALADSETRFEKFFEESPLGVAIIDDQGVVKDCNPALSKMLGRAVEAVENNIFLDMIDKADWSNVSDVLKKIRDGNILSDPFEIRLWVESRKDALPCQLFARQFSAGTNIALYLIDLSHQKNLENQFIQSQKMQAVGQLAGGIAHDFNNLLTAIIGFCDLLLLRHKPGDPSFADIQQIKQNSNRAANLVRQLLAFSRQQTLRPQIQDITDILTEVSHLLRRLIGVNIELKLNHGQNLGFVKVDGGQMEQVLVNMAVNARDAMPEGGILTISTSYFQNETSLTFGEDTMPVGNWVRIDVRDTGTGIPPDTLARIFEPFFTTKDVGKGTGLGLATVYGIIRQTGGYLGVDSEVGVGTCFTIYLPHYAENEMASDRQESKPEELEKDLTGTARILLVEDEDAVRTFSTRALTNKGYEVLTAENGDAGLAVFKEQEKPFDLLITDVMMPGMDGPTLAREIRAEMPNLKIIFISGYTEEKLKDTLGENIFFLPKPFTLKQLAGKVKEVLGE